MPIRLLAPLLAALAACAAAVPARAYDPNRPRDWAGAPDGETWFRLGWVLHQAERYEDAIQAFSQALDERYREPVSMYNIACGFARLGQVERSFEWIGRALEAGFSRPEWMERDPDLAALRGDPRFARTLAGLRARRGRSREG